MTTLRPKEGNGATMHHCAGKAKQWDKSETEEQQHKGGSSQQCEQHEEMAPLSVWASRVAISFLYRLIALRVY